jgi:cytochrome P450
MSDMTSATAGAPRPAHVTDAAFYDFDIFKDPAYLQDPHSRILEILGEAPPVFWTPRNGGHWVMLNHKANFECGRDTETFSSGFIDRKVLLKLLASLPEGSPRYPQPSPIMLDPPEHGIYRAPLLAPFSPKEMTKLKAKIRELSVGCFEAIKPLGSADIMQTVAEIIPVQVFLEMFGLPLERQREYRALVQEQLAAFDQSQDSMPGRMIKVVDTMRDTLIDRRDNPKDDLISMLWQSKIGDREPTLEDLEDYSVLLFIAGLDTVVNGIGHAVIHLARNPDLQAQLRADPSLVPGAVEEILRRYTFTVPPRRVAKDTVFMGVEMKANERVMLFLPGADLDAAEYPEPAQYRQNREGSSHIAFGIGPHRCLGSHLARYELQIVYEELLGRLPEFRLDPDKPLHYHGGHVIGPDAVWLRWDT